MGDMEFTFENSMDWNGTTDATQSLAENYAYLARIPLPYSPVGQSWPNFYTKQMKGWRLTKVGYPGWTAVANWQATQGTLSLRDAIPSLTPYFLI